MLTGDESKMIPQCSSKEPPYETTSMRHFPELVTSVLKKFGLGEPSSSGGRFVAVNVPSDRNSISHRLLPRTANPPGATVPKPARIYSIRFATRCSDETYGKY